MSRKKTVDVKITSILPAPGMKNGFAIEAVIEGAHRPLIMRGTGSGVFFAEETSLGMMPALLPRRVREALIEQIESEFGRELPREVPRHIKQEVNELIHVILTRRAAIERVSLQAEAYQDLAAFRIKYAKELGA